MKTTLILLATLLTAFSFAQVPSYVPANGLVGYWPFNGNANDASGNGNNGTVNGATLTNDRFGNFSSAYEFNGINNNINLGSSSIFGLTVNNVLTFSIWINASRASNNAQITDGVFSKYQDLDISNSNYYFSIDRQSNQSSPPTGIITANGTNTVETVCNLNSWQHYVILMQSGMNNLRIYRNGILETTGTLNFSSIISNSNLFIGYIPTSATNITQSNFLGKIDDFGIWNRALSECEVKQLYQAQLLNTSSSTSISSCNNYTWTNGQTYSQSGTYTQNLTNQAGCDSVATLNLTITNPSNSTTSISSCNNYTWTNGQTYSQSGTYTQNLTNQAGCDSVATLNLTITNPSNSTTTISSCNNYTWTNGQTYSQSGTYTQNLTNQAGCDSVATLNLTINSVNTGINNSGTQLTALEQNASYQWIDCANQIVIANETQQFYIPDQNGSYAAILTAANGCEDTTACESISILSINETSSPTAFFNNPIGDKLTVTLANSNEVSVLIYASNGQLVYDNKEIAAFTIQTSSWKKGVYFMVIDGVSYELVK